jgi:pantoate--beta-alanine ligase
MEIVSTASEMQTISNDFIKKGKIIGFVPTMGYFHEGHLSLMQAAKADSNVLVVSIFVNPTQFGPGEDYHGYPRDLERDKKMALEVGVDILCNLSNQDMYPPGFCTYTQVERLTEVLCGKSRPGHFRGVTTVVTKLFHIVKPHLAYFGQKDVQQVVVIKKMVQDLNFDIKIKVLPIVREEDGLAMSSRNTYLTEVERAQATILFRALCAVKKTFTEGEITAEKLIAAGKDVLNTEPQVKIDYFEIREIENLSSISLIKSTAIVALAAFVGKVRLIDNMILTPHGGKPL